ncbi:hypothetical protein JYU34_001387 [Plutella xylostella]|uniref:TIR domain-containing protein n=1 Tax=Plutella xylostella TaxID=51655 RepID=A0ABQ7R3S8_PLUXY|nr:hypothetical protein JYU34_001387 [Plutella xylostella]
MPVRRYFSCLWLLLCYSQYSKSDSLEQYVLPSGAPPAGNWMFSLPVVLGVDKTSGCICRANALTTVVVCFGGYDCRRFPKVKTRSEILRVRTSIIDMIEIGQLDYLYYLKTLELEANHRLKYIEPGSFRNLTHLEELSISYSTGLHNIYPRTFEGLLNLKNLTMVNNGFSGILHVVPALRPLMLPSLESLDLSENIFEMLPRDAFRPMQGTRLKRLRLNLCQIEYIHPNAFLPLRNLKALSIGENELNTTLIEDFLIKMIEQGINLTFFDLSGMGFRRHLPKKLLEVVAQSTITKLLLSRNQFEIILDNSFPYMKNIELLDLSKVSAVSIGAKAFDTDKFPNLKVLYLNGNILPGIHNVNVAAQLKLLDLSCNTLNSVTPTYYEIDRDSFINSSDMKILNLSFNRIKSVSKYTFIGLDNLLILNLENGTIFHIGPGTFKSTPHLEVLNLANNPLTESENFTISKFEGLYELKYLTLRNCGIKFLDSQDNIFENMPKLEHLILRNNQLYYITAEVLQPLTKLRILDVRENFLIAWPTPLFNNGVHPQVLLFSNNKISHFSMSMLEDFNHIFRVHKNSTDIDLRGNIYVCDCNAMYSTYTWIEANASYELKQYFKNSEFLCTSPDLWEDKRVFDYLLSIKSLPCIMYDKISKLMIFIQTTPAIIMIMLLALIAYFVIKFRVYIRYWLFLGKLALGRKFIRSSLKAHTKIDFREYKYDAFVSYCNEDRDFVLEMIAEMESNPPFLKLCVYERDFEIGSFISESILNSINESRYIILVISNGFAKSQWCRWETQLAEYHRLFLEDGTSYDPLVLVRIGHIEPKYLSTTLKFLLKTKIYLSWEEQRQDEFWKKLRNVLTKR